LPFHVSVKFESPQIGHFSSSTKILHFLHTFPFDIFYFEYLSGNVSASRLRRLFLAKMSSVDGAINCFVRLKNEFWPHDLSQAM